MRFDAFITAHKLLYSLNQHSNAPHFLTDLIRTFLLVEMYSLKTVGIVHTIENIFINLMMTLNCALKGSLLNVVFCCQGAASLHKDAGKPAEEEEPWLDSKTGQRETTRPVSGC